MDTIDINLLYRIFGSFMTVSFGLILAILILSGAWRRGYIMFTLYILGNSIWGYADYLMGHTDDYLDIWRQYNIINILNPYFFYLYAQTLSHKFHKQLNIFFGGVGSMLIFLNYYRNILIPDSIVELTGYELFKNIFSYNVLALYALGLYGISALWIYKNYKSSKKIVKILIVLGAILTTIGEFVSYSTVYSEITYSIPYLDLSFVFPYLITYLVLKHRLFDARSSLLHLLRWIFIYGSGLILVSLMGWGIMVFSHREIVYNLDLVFLVAIFAITTKLLAKSHWIRRRFQISDLVKLEKSVQEFLTSSSVYTSYDELLKHLLKTLQAGLKISTIELIGGEDLKKIPEIVKIFANKSKAPKSISLKEEINNNVPSTCVEELGKIGELCISIYTDKKLSHMITLPEKNSQSPYTESEKNILYMLRPKIALSLQFLEYNKHLQDEVDHQTKKISQQGKELEISYGKLEALDKEKDVFMNMAAHELRTPMTIIHGYADIMLDPMSGELNQMQKKLVENILKGSDSLIALVNDLLDLSRIDAGKMKLIYEPCNLPSTTREIFEQFSSLMKQKSIEFTLDEKIDVKQVFLIDKDKLILVFTNLLSNAYKYTPEHGKANFSLSTIVKNGLPWLQFSVQDTGIGIPQEEIPHVFDRFATISTHNNIKSTIQSTGLGLSIVKKIVTGMNGTISVVSVTDQGTTFTVEIPYTPEKS